MCYLYGYYHKVNWAHQNWFDAISFRCKMFRFSVICLIIITNELLSVAMLCNWRTLMISRTDVCRDMRTISLSSYCKHLSHFSGIKTDIQQIIWRSFGKCYRKSSGALACSSKRSSRLQIFAFAVDRKTFHSFFFLNWKLVSVIMNCFLFGRTGSISRSSLNYWAVFIILLINVRANLAQNDTTSDYDEVQPEMLMVVMVSESIAKHKIVDAIEIMYDSISFIDMANVLPLASTPLIHTNILTGQKVRVR